MGKIVNIRVFAENISESRKYFTKFLFVVVGHMSLLTYRYQCSQT